MSTIKCPSCGESEFETRGTRRTYHSLNDDLEADGWDEGDVDMDTDDAGNEIIYCVVCTCEYILEDNELHGPIWNETLEVN